tara:strand:- start:183 stop:650 length:468 start_codon:yes stop_codon:yes gene_type:complete
MDKGRIMQLNEMKPNRTIKNPHWTNDKKNQIHCEFHYENGPIVNACVSDTKNGNPDWKEIFDKFDIKEIEQNTQKVIQDIDYKIKFKKREKKEKSQAAKIDTLFNRKLEAFEISTVKNSKDRNLKSLIRKASNETEVYAYTAALILKEMKNEENK